MFAFAGLLIELVATFGLLLGSRSQPKRQKKKSLPANIYEALKLKVDENGNVTTSYRELADDLGWHIKGRKPDVSQRQKTAHKTAGRRPTNLHPLAHRHKGQVDGVYINEKTAQIAQAT